MTSLFVECQWEEATFRTIRGECAVRIGRPNEFANASPEEKTAAETLKELTLRSERKGSYVSQNYVLKSPIHVC